MLVSGCRAGKIPGSGETSPTPVFCARPAQPDHTSAAAGAARTSSGQDRTVLAGRAIAGDRSAAAGPLVRAGNGPRGPGASALPAGRAPAVTATMGITTLPAWR